MEQVPLNYSGFFPQIYHPYTYVNWDHSLMNAESWQVKCQQLQSKIQELQKENMQLKEEKELLEQQSSRFFDQNGNPVQFPKSRRPYKKRSKQLKKHLRCPYECCESRYSSRIALNSHLRKKHRRKQTTL